MRLILSKAEGRIRDPKQRKLYHQIFDLVDKLATNDRLQVLRAISVRYAAEREHYRLQAAGIRENIFGDDRDHDEEEE